MNPELQSWIERAVISCSVQTDVSKHCIRSRGGVSEDKEKIINPNLWRNARRREQRRKGSLIWFGGWNTSATFPCLDARCFLSSVLMIFFIQRRPTDMLIFPTSQASDNPPLLLLLSGLCTSSDLGQTHNILYNDVRRGEEVLHHVATKPEFLAIESSTIAFIPQNKLNVKGSHKKMVWCW